MSASSKKKLRNEQQAAKMTERQLTEQKEAKKLKAYTFLFTAVLAVIVVVALVFSVTQFVTNSGIREKNTVAATIGEDQLSNAELNYYFIDAVNEFNSYYGSYASWFGLDLTKPLNEQIVNEETGETWADDFTNSALENAKATYALVNAANAAGFTLSEDDQAAIDSQIQNISVYGMLYGYSDSDDYIRAMYGTGASLESYRAYLEMNTLANAYYNHYSQSLTYEDADLRAAEEENFAQFSAFSYNTYYLNAGSFLTGGTTDAEGKTTYSDEERAAAVAAAEEAAKTLTAEEIVTVEDLDAAIAALEINAESTTAKSTAYNDQAYASVNSIIRDWIADPARVDGDITYIANISHSHAEGETHSDDEDTSAYDTVNGYYVVLFRGTNDNSFALANVRHILVKPEGGSYNSSTGATTYTEEELLAAKIKAEELLAQWQGGKASEETFAAMATEHTADTGSKDNGGLYENIYPGQMVPTFNDWCFDEIRKAGDTGIVESDYGYHIMFYVGDSDVTYRDFMIENQLRSDDTNAWYTALVEAMVVTELNTKYLSKDLVFSAG